MADGELLRNAGVAEYLAQVVRQEVWIIAKTTYATGFGDDLALCRSGADQHARLVRESGCTHEFSRRRKRGAAAQLSEQSEVVGGVQCKAAQVIAPGPALASDSGAARQCGDTQTGIVCEGRESGSSVEVLCLGQRVFLERIPRFDGFFIGGSRNACLGQIGYLDATPGEEIAQLTQLPCATGG